MSRRKIISTDSNSLEEPWINLMPLIDVVFVVLIMFIVIAPMLDIDQVQLAEGTSVVKELNVKNTVTIHVRGDDSIWVQKRRVNLNELYNYLIQARHDYPRSVPQVFHDKRAHFGTYQDVKNTMEKAGYRQMDIILKPT